MENGGNTTKDIVKEPRQIKQDDSTIVATAKSEITKDNTDRIIKVEDIGVSDTDSTSIVHHMNTMPEIILRRR